MAAELFTIIIPTFNHEETLNYSLASITKQTVTNFEVLIIGDGATAKTKKIVETFAQKDKRFRYFSFPKSLRTGEPYRHELLAKVSSRYVCYLSDDDLWLPDHLEQMQQLLKNADFSYTFPIMIQPDGSTDTWYGDLQQKFYKDIFLHLSNRRYNVIPLSCAGHTLAAYKKLPSGWQTTPFGKHTDLHMWQQFVLQKNIKLKKGKLPTVLHFASSQRGAMSKQQRQRELAAWSKKIATKESTMQLRVQLLADTLEKVNATFLTYRAAVESTKTWRLHNWLLQLFARFR